MAATHTLIVEERLEGWFVTNGSTTGPLISKEQALDLAQGMAAAMSRDGQQVDVQVAARQAPRHGYG